MSLRPVPAGAEVVEDYRQTGLSLRNHPVWFVREDLRRRGIVSCVQAMESRDGCRLETAGVVLVRQRPGSAKGVMFVTLEDETGIANLVVWSKLYERRRIILSTRMIAVHGRVQREGAVVHLVAQRLADLSAELASISAREAPFPLPHGRGDEFYHGTPNLDLRSLPQPCDVHDPHRHSGEMWIKTRDFR